MTEQKRIVIAGDVVVAWHIAQHRAGPWEQAWFQGDRTVARLQPGAAALDLHLIREIFKNSRSVKVQGPNPPSSNINPFDQEYNHSFDLWTKQPKVSGTQQQEFVWRVAQYLGPNIDRTRVRPPEALEDWSDSPTVYVLNDSNFGFRHTQECWPDRLRKKCNGHEAWIILRLAAPINVEDSRENLLFHTLDANDWLGRTVAVVTAKNLREADCRISKGLSWERTVEDMVIELNRNPRLSRLRRCAHLIVSFPTVAALHRHGSAGELWLDPNEMEETWPRRHPGKMVGYIHCLVAALAKEFVASAPDLSKGIKSALGAMRTLHTVGWNFPKPENANQHPTEKPFPCDNVAEALEDETTQAPFRCCTLRPPQLTATKRPANPSWTILGQVTDMTTLAERIVRMGVDEAVRKGEDPNNRFDGAEQIPILKLGKLVSLDRNEIEGLRNIANLFGEYMRSESPKPMAIAVFGPPGSGKTWSVGEVADSLSATSQSSFEFEKIDFNLSQFSGPSQLFKALHQVRDIGLRGNVPLVFWDEFDTSLDGQQLGWLAYFLGPMLDGKFQEGEVSHYVGRAVFVFAGGTHQRAEQFVKKSTRAEFKKLKVPDFLSRLKGFVNVPGVNPRTTISSTADGSRRRRSTWSAVTDDPFILVRRAVLLRSAIERHRPKLLEDTWIEAKEIRRNSYKTKEKSEPTKENKLRLVRKITIDPGVLYALLRIDRYKHGARSLESILAMSKLEGESNFHRSALPSKDQLDLHVSAMKFLKLVDEGDARK